jgi:hypothetical protein
MSDDPSKWPAINVGQHSSLRHVLGHFHGLREQMKGHPCSELLLEAHRAMMKAYCAAVYHGPVPPGREVK